MTPTQAEEFINTVKHIANEQVLITGKMKRRIVILTASTFVLLGCILGLGAIAALQAIEIFELKKEIIQCSESRATR